MTVCITSRIKYKDKYLTLIGSDSEVSDSTSRVADILGDSKLYRAHDAVIAISGMGPLSECLEDMISNQAYMRSLRFNTKKDVRKFVSKLFGEMRGLLEEAVISPDILQHIGILLLAKPGHIYSIWNDLSVFEHDHFYTSGAGEHKAAGSMEVLHEALRERIDEMTEEQAWQAFEEIIYRSISAASKTILGVGGKIKIERVTERVLPPVQKRGRKPKK